MSEGVSVVVTCYNLEKYIASALSSIQDQDYPGPIDVIVVDDCSTDSSARIIHRFPFVRYLRTSQNIGVLGATLLGLRNVTTDIVFFLDGDDVWHPSKVNSCCEKLLSDDRMAFVTHNIYLIDGGGKKYFDSSIENRYDLGYDGSSDKVRMGIVYNRDYVWLGSAYAIRQSLANIEYFMSVAEDLSDIYNTYQDWTLATWIACQPNVTFGYLRSKLMGYRVHSENYSGDSRTVSKALRSISRTINTLRFCLDTLKRYQMGHSVIREVQAKKDFYVYLLNLYTNQRILSTYGYLSSLSYIIHSRSFFKECFRFIGILILGADKFLSLTQVLRGK